MALIIPDLALHDNLVPQSTDFLLRASASAVIHQPPASVLPCLAADFLEAPVFPPSPIRGRSNDPTPLLCSVHPSPQALS